MALTFSLSAALLAILVQQWVRDYMHIFQRYSDPLKSARMRQYLYEGSEGWYMPTAAEAVPGLLHVSLFLFFVGLADSTLNFNTTIGVTTTVPIGICGLLYIFTTLAPVIYPQSPYQTSFSGLLWYAIQKLRGRIFKDRDGESNAVSTNMAQGQMQLSMEETKERKSRDKRAIRWLLDNLTEDAEIESFAMSIPGPFNGEWSFEVWTELSKSKEGDMPAVAQPLSRSRTIRNVLSMIPRRFKTRTASHSPADAMIRQPTSHSTSIHHPIVTPSAHEKNTVRELSKHVGHLFETCKNRAVFASDELWRRRVRACVAATVSLVFYADAELDWFGDILGTLGDIGNFEGIRNLVLSGRDQPFVVRWTCLSIMTFREFLRSNVVFREQARLAVESFESWLSDCADEAAEKNAWKIDKTLEDQWESQDYLYDKVSSTLKIIKELDGMDSVDSKAAILNEAIDKAGQRITRQLPGVHFDFVDSMQDDSGRFFCQALELVRDPPNLRFTSCRQPKKIVDFFSRAGHEQYQGSLVTEPAVRNLFWPKKLLQRTLWSLQDFYDGGGLGVAIEVFLLAFKELLSSSPS